MAVSVFEERFKGGHPNSLGNTIEIVEEVLADKSELEELVNTWQSEDEIVRLRVANGVRRVCVAHPDWIAPYLNHFIDNISHIDQPSTQWTLAKLFEMLEPLMDTEQKSKATKIMQNNLANHNDWIVLNNTMETLNLWAEENARLKIWLKPHLVRLTNDTRNSVAKRANKILKTGKF